MRRLPNHWTKAFSVAEDFGTAVILPTVAVLPADRQGDGAHWREGDHKKPPERRPVIDATPMLGLADGSIPPAIQACLSGLVEEVERLREQVDVARHHEAFLQSQLDRHPFLPCLTRRAFLAATARLVDTSLRVGLPGTLVYLQLAGIDRLKVVHGLAAADAALTHVVALIAGQLRQTDLLGHLDGGDFAVALAVSEDGGAEDKARRIARHIAEHAFDWQGRRFLFTATLGVAHFQEDRTAEQLLADADAARRSGDDVGQQGVFQAGDLILEDELPLFQPFQF